MRNQEMVKVYDATPRHTETRKSTRSRLTEVVGEALGAAIVIAITVKFIMWIL